MASLKKNQNLEVQKNWDREASSFWQEVAKPRGNCQQANLRKTSDSLWCEESDNFWKELASQRAL